MPDARVSRPSQGRTIEEMMFGYASLGKRQPLDDDDVQIIGIKIGKPMKTKKKKLKTKFLNDISSWTANRALIDIDKENSSRDSNQEAESKQGSKDKNLSEQIKKFHHLKPTQDKKLNKPAPKSYHPSMWS